MKPSVRLRVCSNCGHLILRSATSSQSSLRSRPESQRSISWRSLFDVITKPEKSDASTDNPKAVNEDSKVRTKSAVQRLRETRDQSRRPLNPPVSRSEREPTRASSPPSQNSPQSPSDLLREKLKERLSLANLNVKQPDTTIATTKTQLYRLQRKAMRKFDLSDPKYKTGAFPTALRSEQHEALMKYLSLASSKREPPKRTAKFPWEEPPLPSETGQHEVRDLLTLKSPPDKSEVEKSIIGTSDYHVIESANLAERFATSKLFQQLQTHHVKTQKALIERNDRLLADGNATLTHRIDSTIQEIRSRIGNPHRYDLLFRKFQTLLSPYDKQIRTTPLIRYITAEQGFNPREAYNIINKFPESFDANPLDKQNRLTTEALETIILDRIASFYINLYLEYDKTLHHICGFNPLPGTSIIKVYFH